MSSQDDEKNISLTAPYIPDNNTPAPKRYTAQKKQSQFVSGGWLTTFTDTIALMLTFFVMTYSMANPKPELWQDVAQEVNMERGDTLGDVAGQGEVNDISLERVQFQNALNLSYLEALLTNQLAKQDLDDIVNVFSDPIADRLILTVPERFLFERGEANITEENQRTIAKLADVLNGIKNSIEIVGHTDPKPFQSGSADFSSNWDLSLQRAMSVAALLKRKGYPYPMHVKGASSSHYSSLPQNLPEDTRMQLSRRVDIIIHDKKEDFSERLGL